MRDDPRWRALPVLEILHEQWWAARGGKVGESQRPFWRDWEELLAAAGLTQADQRREAERDARALEGAGLVRLKAVKYRSKLIDRIGVPVEQERRLAALFGDVLETDDPGIDLTSIAWEPELRFVTEARLGVAAGDLLKINAFLAEGGRGRPIVPIKERSIQIFGDEKRLDALLPTALFRPGRLTLEALRCEFIGEPLAWARGPHTGGPVLIIENAATWHTYCRWNAERGLFSAVVYGKGLVIQDSVRYLVGIFKEIGGAQRVQYFGNLDPAGVAIASRASAYARQCGLPEIEPHLWSYKKLLELGQGKEVEWEGDPIDKATLAWLGVLVEPVQKLFADGKRLAQELVGWEYLRGQTGVEKAV